MWGTAASSTQCEGAASASDWWDWERAGHAPGYAIWADGLGLVLDDLHARYLARGVEVTRQAIARGVDVRGFFHWTAVDNYEWLHGNDVSFGLIARDRTVRPSARVLQREARGPGST